MHLLGVLIQLLAHNKCQIEANMFCVLLSCLPRFSPSIAIDLDNDHCTSLNNALLLLILILILLCFSSFFVLFCFCVFVCFGF